MSDLLVLGILILIVINSARYILPIIVEAYRDERDS